MSTSNGSDWNFQKKCNQVPTLFECVLIWNCRFVDRTNFPQRGQAFSSRRRTLFLTTSTPPSSLVAWGCTAFKWRSKRCRLENILEQDSIGQGTVFGYVRPMLNPFLLTSWWKFFKWVWNRSLRAKVLSQLSTGQGIRRCGVLAERRCLDGRSDWEEESSESSFFKGLISNSANSSSSSSSPLNNLKDII